MSAVADEKNNVAMVDLVEYCNLWAMPPWTFFGGPTMRLHVILGFVDTPDGKKIAYQVLPRRSLACMACRRVACCMCALEQSMPAVLHVPQGFCRCTQHVEPAEILVRASAFTY